MNPTPGGCLELSHGVAVAYARVLELSICETILLWHRDKELSLGCKRLGGFDHLTTSIAECR